MCPQQALPIISAEAGAGLPQDWEAAMVAVSGYALIREDIDELADAWREAGSQLSFDLTTNYGRCAVDGCHGMAFVGLRTERGPRPVCLKHYSMLDIPRAN